MSLCTQHANLKNRLARIEGHIRGVSRMIDEGKDCESILIQLAAIEAACRKVSQILLETHLTECVVDGIKNGDEIVTIESLKSALKHYL